MALGAMLEHNIPVTIICCGLNYYRGHKFRSRVVAEWGQPYEIPP